MRCAVGMMSGTSIDGIDAVLLRVAQDRAVAVGAHHFQPYPEPLRERLLTTARESQAVSARDWAALDSGVGEAYATAGTAVLAAASAEDRARVEVIGMHGQTLCHVPPDNSLQVGNPARLAAATGLPVVADFRRMDMALGGQGAPLVPAFHCAVLGREDEVTAVLNIGGIANLSLLPPRDSKEAVRGFDTGPGNTLLDAWHRRHQGGDYDADGAWAASGQPLPRLLERWLEHPYFHAAPPKSTGQGAFNLDALFALAAPEPSDRAEDVQATLLALTASSIARACRPLAPDRVLVCGGGARNGTLMARLAAELAPIPVATTEEAAGLAVDQVEAAAFAWLALRRLDGLPGTLASVTGARCDAPAGALYLPPAV